MNITILGGSGFIGSHLAEVLLKEHHNLTLFGRSNTDCDNIKTIKDKASVITGDFNHPEELDEAVVGAEVVVHLISTTVVGNSMKNPAFDVASNVVGTVKLLELCVKAKVRKIVFVSSGGTVYGVPQYLPIKENHPLNPISSYGISKLAIEKYLGLFNFHHEIDYTVLRLSNPYGERQSVSSGQGVIASWLQRISKGLPIEIWGNGDTIRDYIYIKDAVQALKLVTLNDSKQKIFNVGSGIGVSLIELHALLQDTIDCKIPVNYKQSRKIDVPSNILDVALIKKVLGWEAQTFIDDGLSRLLQETF